LSGGQLAPLFYASGGEVNFQVPWELAGATQVSVSALLNNQPGASQTVNIAPFAPGIFSLNSQGTGQGAILDSSYKVVDASNPATAGSSYIQIYATGLGAVSHQPASGSPALAVPLSMTAATPTVTIGGATATVLFSGLAPTLVGVYQINALVPAGSAIGVAVPVSISIGGASSNIVTMAVNPAPGPNPVPSISALSPFSAAPGSTSSTLTITGDGFVPASSVTLNGASQSTTFVSGTQLTVTLNAPALVAAGSFPVAVVNASPGGGTSMPSISSCNRASARLPQVPSPGATSAAMRGTPHSRSANRNR
jgi:uncharacterized protein (TIGR03437 family)